MAAQDRVIQIREAVENEAHHLAEDGNYGASNALFELLEGSDNAIIRFADIIKNMESHNA